MVPTAPEAGLIQNASLGQKLIQALGIRGRTQAPTLAPEVSPVIVVDDLTAANWFNQGVERPAAGANTFLPVVGQYASAQIWNPANSGVVAIVDMCWFGLPATTNVVLIGLGQVALTNNSPVLFRDTVKLAAQQPACQLRYDSLGAAGFGSTIGYLQSTTTNIPLRYEPGVILAPGWGLRFDVQIPTVALHFTGQWRERFQ